MPTRVYEITYDTSVAATMFDGEIKVKSNTNKLEYKMLKEKK